MDLRIVGQARRLPGNRGQAERPPYNKVTLRLMALDRLIVRLRPVHRCDRNFSAAVRRNFVGNLRTVNVVVSGGRVRSCGAPGEQEYDSKNH